MSWCWHDGSRRGPPTWADLQAPHEQRNVHADPFWGASPAIWNNDGDTVKVLDPQGHVVTSYSY